MLFLLILSMLSASVTYSQNGAGPDDIYGGPSVNNNICTPYHFVPEERSTLSYQWAVGPDYVSLDPGSVTYWTQGNNISQTVDATGAYWVGGSSAGWQQGALACIYPRGSAYKMIRSQCVFQNAVGEFNGREPKDTTHLRYIGGTNYAGRIPTDLGYREDLEHWNEKYVGSTQRLHVSTRPSDLEEWPEEFQDENGDPIIISDEDVVIVHFIRGSYFRSWVELEQQDASNNPMLEYQGRVLSFSASIARDIQFYDYKIINKSAFHPYPDVGPYDVEEFMLGPTAIFEMGDQKGGQKIAFVPKHQFGFTYEETFSDPAIDGNSPMGGFTIIRACERPDPNTGEIVPGELVSFSAAVAGGGWGYYSGLWEYPIMMYRICRAEPQFVYLQDPGFGDDPESELPIISRTTEDEFSFNYFQDIPLCPGDTTNMVYALCCAFPSVDDPASMAGTPRRAGGGRLAAYPERCHGSQPLRIQLRHAAALPMDRM